MKRYALFAGYNYYPSGGWDDIYGTYDTVEEAQEAWRIARSNPERVLRSDWGHIIDLTTGEETRVVK